MSHWLHNSAEAFLAPLSSAERQSLLASRLDGTSMVALEPTGFGESRDLPVDLVAAALTDKMHAERPEIYLDAEEVVLAALKALGDFLSDPPNRRTMRSDAKTVLAVGRWALTAIDGAGAAAFARNIRSTIQLARDGGGDTAEVFFAAVSALSALPIGPDDLSLWASLVRNEDSAMIAIRVLADLAPNDPIVLRERDALKARLQAVGDLSRLETVDEIFAQVSQEKSEKTTDSKVDGKAGLVEPVVLDDLQARAEFLLAKLFHIKSRLDDYSEKLPHYLGWHQGSLSNRELPPTYVPSPSLSDPNGAALTGLPGGRTSSALPYLAVHPRRSAAGRPRNVIRFGSERHIPRVLDTKVGLAEQ